MLSTDSNKFSSPHGWQICRKIIADRLPFGPHDYQLEGITHALDGQDVVAVSATGSGKSAYIYMLAIVLLELGKKPMLSPIKKRFPEDPAIVVVCPTTALEDDLEGKIQGFGISAKAINAVTKMEMERESKNIWKYVESNMTVLLVSPEMLATPGFQQLLQTNKFKSRICALIIDEIHLLNSWGAGFRPHFQQIGFLRARFPSNTVLLGLTATLRKGKYKDNVFKFLGLDASKVHFIQRSNARPGVKLLIRTLRANTNTEHFPQLDWVLREKGHVLIFCPSIRTGFRLAVYLWHLDPRSAVVNQTIRLFNSLNSTSYNLKTLQLLRENEHAKITIATDKLSVGVDIPNFETVVVVDPVDLDDLWQKGGRVGRDKKKVKSPKVIVYIPNHKMTALEDIVSDLRNNNGRARQKKSRPRQIKQTEPVDEGLPSRD